LSRSWQRSCEFKRIPKLIQRYLSNLSMLFPLFRMYFLLEFFGTVVHLLLFQMYFLFKFFCTVVHLLLFWISFNKHYILLPFVFFTSLFFFTHLCVFVFIMQEKPGNIACFKLLLQNTCWKEIRVGM
jgi:hypothetical protein